MSAPAACDRNVTPWYAGVYRRRGTAPLFELTARPMLDFRHGSGHPALRRARHRGASVAIGMTAQPLPEDCALGIGGAGLVSIGLHDAPFRACPTSEASAVGLGYFIRGTAEPAEGECCAEECEDL